MDLERNLKIIIAGGRDFDDYELLLNKCNNIIPKGVSVEIVSGTAKGADSLGEKYAKANGFKLKQFPADWESLGKRAGIIINREMAEYATHLIAFWDFKSKGTANMIHTAHEHSLQVRVIKY